MAETPHRPNEPPGWRRGAKPDVINSDDAPLGATLAAVLVVEQS